MDSGSPRSIQLEDLTHVDIEAQAPPEPKLSILKRIATSSNQSIIAESTRTAITYFAKRNPTVLLRWATFSTQSTRVATPDSLNVRLEQAAFLDAVTGPNLRSEDLTISCKWYTIFLRCKIEEAWVPLFQPVLIGICCWDRTPCESCIELAFACLKTVVSVFRKRDLALVEISDELYNKGLLREDSADDDRSNAKQLVFAAFGWISLLYTPESKPEKAFLQIVDRIETEQNSIERSRARPSPRYKSKTFTSCRQALEYVDQPLYTFLKRFGKIIPEAYRDSSATHESASTQLGRHEGGNDLSLVCFHILHKFAGVTIEWVDCLSQHLEFDSRTKMLKLFRFPSLCFIMCSNTDQSLMSRIFQESGAAPSDSTRPDIDDAYEYFKEVLLSYSLIFSQTKSSRKAFQKQSKKWNLKSRGNMDPILERLCAHSCDSDEARELYWAIEADDPSIHFNPISDFPFLGKRLTDIQDYVSSHNPHSFMALWYDRRNVTWWWTFWAVIIIGGIGLFLALVQTVFQILQAFKP